MNSGGGSTAAGSTAAGSTASGGGTSSSSPVADADAGLGTSDDGLTETSDLPLPVAPYALVSGYPSQRRRCFVEGYDNCRRSSR